MINSTFNYITLAITFNVLPTFHAINICNSDSQSQITVQNPTKKIKPTSPL